MTNRTSLRRLLAIVALVAVPLLTSCESTDLAALKNANVLKGLTGGDGPLTIDEITRGLKEALSQGSSNVVGQLGKSNGFNSDPLVRIPLPSTLQKGRDIAAKVGLAGSFDQLQNKLNEAAEVATPKAKDLFLGAIRQMTVADAQSILRGPDNAATKYFEDKTRTQLSGAMRPIVDQSLSQVGAVNTFNQLLAQYKSIPFAPKLNADLTQHVVDKGMDGIFRYLAAEEKAIRENPVKRTTALLKRVFGS